MPKITITFGASRIDRIVEDVDELLYRYRQDTGCYYLDYKPTTPSDRVVPEDIGVTLLVNSQVGWRAFYSLMEHAGEIDLALLPRKPLDETKSTDRDVVAALIARMAQWPGFAASVSTKVLHKKRPDLIPILDNQAIFGAYMNPDWNPPKRLARSDSVKSEKWIREALDWIAFDLNRPENVAAWEQLHTIEPARTRIQLFDSVWWMYFRTVQPVKWELKD